RVVAGRTPRSGGLWTKVFCRQALARRQRGGTGFPNSGCGNGARRIAKGGSGRSAGAGEVGGGKATAGRGQFFERWPDRDCERERAPGDRGRCGRCTGGGWDRAGGWRACDDAASERGAGVACDRPYGYAAWLCGVVVAGAAGAAAGSSERTPVLLP